MVAALLMAGTAIGIGGFMIGTLNGMSASVATVDELRTLRTVCYDALEAAERAAIETRQAQETFRRTRGKILEVWRAWEGQDE